MLDCIFLRAGVRASFSRVGAELLKKVAAQNCKSKVCTFYLEPWCGGGGGGEGQKRVLNLCSNYIEYDIFNA